jgi:hypothetical protein
MESIKDTIDFSTSHYLEKHGDKYRRKVLHWVHNN